jgi:hypothetical protein
LVAEQEVVKVIVRRPLREVLVVAEVVAVGY